MHCSFNTYVNAFLAKARFINFWSNYFLNVLSTLLPTQLTLLFVNDLFGTLKGNSCVCLHEQLNSFDSNSNWCYRSYAFILIHYDSKKLWFFLFFFFLWTGHWRPAWWLSFLYLASHNSILAWRWSLHHQMCILENQERICSDQAPLQPVTGDKQGFMSLLMRPEADERPKWDNNNLMRFKGGKHWC